MTSLVFLRPAKRPSDYPKFPAPFLDSMPSSSRALSRALRSVFARASRRNTDRRRKPRLQIDTLETRLVPYTASFASTTYVIDPEDGTGIGGSVKAEIQLSPGAPSGGLTVYVSTEDGDENVEGGPARVAVDYAQLDYEPVVFKAGETCPPSCKYCRPQR